MIEMKSRPGDTGAASQQLAKATNILPTELVAEYPIKRKLTRIKLAACATLGHVWWSDHKSAGHVWSTGPDREFHILRLHLKGSAVGTAVHVCCNPEFSIPKELFR